MEEIVALEATLYRKSCWRSAGVCERATQCSGLICCGCKKDGNNRQTFIVKVVKSVFVVLRQGGKISCTVVWLWEGQWVWAVEKWLDIIPKTHNILPRDITIIIKKHVLVLIQLLMYLRVSKSWILLSVTVTRFS